MSPRRQQRDPEGNLVVEEKGGEEDRIPKSRVDAMMKSARDDSARIARAEERARLETERREAAETRNSTPPPATETQDKIYTHEELQTLVDGGQITDTQMRNQLDQQQERRIHKNVTEEVREERTVSDRARVLNVELDQYKAFVPGIVEPASDDRVKLHAEITRLVGQGFPRDLSTEVIACRICFGAPETQKPVPELVHEEPGAPGGSGSGETDEIAEEETGVPKGLSTRHKAFYLKNIQLGRYSGWKDPDLLKEMKHIPGVEVAA